MTGQLLTSSHIGNHLHCEWSISNSDHSTLRLRLTAFRVSTTFENRQFKVEYSFIGTYSRMSIQWKTYIQHLNMINAGLNGSWLSWPLRLHSRKQNMIIYLQQVYGFFYIISSRTSWISILQYQQYSGEIVLTTIVARSREVFASHRVSTICLHLVCDLDWSFRRSKFKFPDLVLEFGDIM